MTEKSGRLSAPELQHAAFDAYVYLYPLVLMEAHRQDWRTMHAGFAPIFHHAIERYTEFPQIPSFAATVGAWIDASRGPVAVSTPDTHGRPLIVTLVDAWGRVDPAFRIPREASQCVFLPPDWRGDLASLDEAQIVRLRTARAWVCAHVIGRADSDADAMRYLASGLQIVRTATPHGVRGPELGPGATPHARVANMDVTSFFTAAAALLKDYPAPPSERRMTRALRMMGLQPSETAAPEALSSDHQHAIREGVATARAAVLTKYEALIARARENWRVGPAPPSEPFFRRAAEVRHAVFSCRDEDLIVRRTALDHVRENLNGMRRYNLHFPPGALRGKAWRLTIADHHSGLPLRGEQRTLRDSDALMFNDDGSLDILIEARHPIERVGNWLRPPRRRFSLLLELLSPSRDALEGVWAPPRVQRLSRAALTRQAPLSEPAELEAHASS